MHFYDFNIGDYAKKTQHLTNEEDLAYRRLLDMYYDTEKPIANPSLNGGIATLSRRLRVDQKALENVLAEFFPDGKNKHADEKIAAYYAYIEKQKANGKQGGRPKHKPTANPPPTQNNPVPSQPLTTKPLTTNHIKYTPPINGELLSDWLEVRKAKRSGRLTATAWKGLEREANNAGISASDAVKICCERSWVTFKAEWYLKKLSSSVSVQEARLDTARQIQGGIYGTSRQIKDVSPGRTIEGDRAGIPETPLRIRQPNDSKVAGD